MNALGISLRHLTFLGPNRKPATIAFGKGLNLVYGASDTGKSFIVDAIDFMLGGRGPLRDITQRVGYDRILLAFEAGGGGQYTLLRSVDGGHFRLFEGLFFEAMPVGEGKELSDQHSDRNEDNLSAFLLEKIGLAKKRIRKNKQNETLSLSFRNLARLVIINEEEIIQRRSPLADGTYTNDTPNMAVFKLLLTGVDDSALISSKSSTPEEHSRDGQIDLLDQLITEAKQQIRDLAGPPAQLEEQLGRIDATMVEQGNNLAHSEAEYREIAGRRRDLMRRLEEGNNRLTEISSLLERFALLDEHYQSDIARLKGIEEAGSLFVSLGDGPCPLCGALAEHHLLTEDCNANVEGVVEAALAEIAKIETRRTELAATITELRKEDKSFRRRLPKLETDLRAISGEIDGIIAPNLRRLRSGYGDLADKRGEVREGLNLFRNLKDLEDRRTKLLETVGAADIVNPAEVGLSTTVVDKFSALVLTILKSWHFPDADRLHFDLKTRDLVINGKNRISYGKGLRAITQAAFTIGLLEYCRVNDTAHPGFVVLDSPLLSYREPDSQSDDLRHTDLNEQFYKYLNGLNAKQVIIIENTDPPADIQASRFAVHFSGNPLVGRVGYFPAATENPPGTTAS